MVLLYVTQESIFHIKYIRPWSIGISFSGQILFFNKKKKKKKKMVECNPLTQYQRWTLLAKSREHMFGFLVFHKSLPKFTHAFHILFIEVRITVATTHQAALPTESHENRSKYSQKKKKEKKETFQMNHSQKPTDHRMHQPNERKHNSGRTLVTNYYQPR